MFPRLCCIESPLFIVCSGYNWTNYSVELGLQLPVVLKPVGLHHEPQGLMLESAFRRSRLKKARPSLESASRGETDKPILSISYEQSLLLTREMLLSDAGFEETSARTHRDALECCRKSKFDLI